MLSTNKDMETLELLDVVVLTEALPHTNLRKGELGWVESTTTHESGYCEKRPRHHDLGEEYSQKLYRNLLRL